MPQTPLYIHTADENSPAAFSKAAPIIAAKWGDEIPPVGDLKEDEKSLETASSTLVAAALNPDFDSKSGLFLRNCQPFEVAGYAKDPERAEKLWRLSEELVGEKFEI